MTRTRTMSKLRNSCVASTEAGLAELAHVRELREEYERLVIELREHYTNDEFLIFPDAILPLPKERTGEAVESPTTVKRELELVGAI